MVLACAAASFVVAAAAGGVLATSGKSVAWDPRVLGIVHFVEQHRGLTFKEPVKVEFLSGRAFDKEVSVPGPKSASDRATLAHALGELRALGLVHGNVDLARADNNLNQADVVGLYVNTKKTVFVRGTTLTPYVRTTLAHELTHALQDQYYNLQKLNDDAQNGDSTAVTALIEGDAVRIQNEYQQSLSAADQQLYQQEDSQLSQASGQAGNVPEILVDMLEFPYAFGPTFVDALATQGGNAAVDHAFGSPPVAEAQIVDPVHYSLSWKPVHVSSPSIGRGHRVEPPSPFGQVSLFEVLGSRLGYDPAWAAVQGWRGDNSVPYTLKGRTCVAIDVRMRDAAAARRLAAAADAWAASLPGAAIASSGSTVSLRSCDPGPKEPAPPPITPSAFDVLAARSGITDAVMTNANVDLALGQCVADGVLAGVGPAGYGELTASSLSAAQQDQLQQVTAASALACRRQGVS